VTTPPPGATSGFQSGDDFVAARVSIDIPTEGVADLREITQEMDRFRTSVESANRSSETFSGYLVRIAEAAQQAATAQQNLVTMLERNIDAQNRAAVAGAGGGPILNAPGQYTNPFANATLGLGGGGDVLGGAGAVGPGDIPSQLEALRTQNPRAYVNKMAASGQYRMGDIAAASPSGADIQSAADRISQRAQLMDEGAAGAGGGIGSRAGRMGALTQQVLNEVNPAASGLGMSGLIQRSLGVIPSVSGLGGALAGMGGGALGTMAGMARSAAVPVGLAMAGYGLVQGAGGVYQDYKNMGLVRGGGATEGVGYEMSIRAMAMNPFISSDQARQIVQQGLRDGYTGKEFDTVTSMVAQNLKDFNIEVGESFKMLRKNVVEGGQTPGAFASNMESLKQLAAQGGYRSLPDLQAGYAATSSSLISAGMGGAGAGQAAMVFGQMFADNPVLAGKGDEIAQVFANNPLALAMMRTQGGVDIPSGVLPQSLPFVLTPEQMTQGANNVLKNQALMIHRGAGKPQQGKGKNYANAIFQFQKRLEMLGFGYTPQQAREMYDQFVYGADPAQSATAEVKEAQRKQTEIKERNLPSRVGGALANEAISIGGQAWDALTQIGGTIKDYMTNNEDHIDDRWNEYNSRYQDRIEGGYDSGSKYKMTALDSLRRAYAKQGGIEVVDANQQVIEIDQNNREQMQQLASGQLKVRRRGGEGGGIALRDVPTDAEGMKTALGGTGGKATVSGSVTIDLTPDAKRMFRVQGGPTIQLNPHQQQANQAYGQATPNNAPPGYGGP